MKKGTGRKPKEPIHKASVDDYDKKTQEKEESIVYPLITYDPGLLDLAPVIVTLSRTQTIMVLPLHGVRRRSRSKPTSSCSCRRSCGVSAFSLHRSHSPSPSHTSRTSPARRSRSFFWR